MEKFTSNANVKLSKFLLKAGYSYNTVRLMLRKKDVLINGVRTKEDVKISEGDEIICYADMQPREKPNIIYKDENILIIDKPQNLTSEELFEQVKEENNGAGFIHRLDRNTSGLIVFSLNDVAEKELKEAFKSRSIKKIYEAEVYGRFAVKTAVLRAYLLKSDDRVYISDKKIANSVEIITGYTVKEEREETTVIEIELITGKTHQIRAHMAYVGHFVIGDEKYGDAKINKKYGANRQRLRSKTISFCFSEEARLKYLNGKVFSV